MKIGKNELDVIMGPPALNLSLNYLFIGSQQEQTEFEDREEVTWLLRSQVSRYWSLFGGQLYDLGERELRQIQVGASYADECLVFSATAQRNFFSDREIEPENTFFFTVVLKHLGGFEG